MREIHKKINGKLFTIYTEIIEGDPFCELVRIYDTTGDAPRFIGKYITNDIDRTIKEYLKTRGEN